MSIAATIVKANTKYICAECGSTELIQAHHQVPGDDRTMIPLCAECHSRKHPNVPKALFFAKDKQPYWHNTSASSIARKFGVHPRTIIRRAKRLDILAGEITQKQINALSRRNSKHQYYRAEYTDNAPHSSTGWLTINDVAKRLKVSGTTVRSYINRGTLIAYKFVGVLRIAESDYWQLIERGKQLKQNDATIV